MFLIKGRTGKNKYELFDSAKNIEVAMFLIEEYKQKHKSWTFKIQYKQFPL